MVYTVEYHDPKGLLGSEVVERFALAKALAEAAVSGGAASRAVVRDPAGTTLFQRPRILRAA